MDINEVAGNDAYVPRWEAVYDPENMWWAVGCMVRGCYDNGLDEAEARALAAALNGPSAQPTDQD